MAGYQVLCYGDSNTWGYNPNFTQEGEYRFPASQRWTGLLQQQLGGAYRIVEEGLGGRTTVFHDPSTPGRRGLDLLVPLLHSHQPLDLVVFMLGTNDTKTVYGAPVCEIAAGMEALLKAALNPYVYDNRTPPRLLLVSPIHVVETPGAAVFGPASAVKSRGLAMAYRELAARYGCAFLDAAQHAAPSPMDGVHLDAEGHQALAAALAAAVRGALEG